MYACQIFFRSTISGKLPEGNNACAILHVCEQELPAGILKIERRSCLNFCLAPCDPRVRAEHEPYELVLDLRSTSEIQTRGINICLAILRLVYTVHDCGFCYGSIC